MPEVPVEPFSNPFAPPEDQVDVRRANLSNDDFRRLLTTPRVTTGVSEATPVLPKERKASTSKQEDEKKQRKKTLYAKLRKEEEERQAEWAKKYRDRAKERRDDKNPDYSNLQESLPSTSSYRAVAPGIVDPTLIAERRKQAIVESKFLGGDIQHTHLVKGLDYVLLDKVRGELQNKEKEARDKMELEKEREKEKVGAEAADDLKFSTTLGKNIYRLLFLSRPPLRNELFFPGRMAYVFEMDDEYSESDIPTVLIRSKADCPVQESTTLTTNDIVINKLTQILSYLRQGMRSGKKGKKKDRGLATGESLPKARPLPKLPGADQSIFDDVGEYVFDGSSSQPSSKWQSSSYFDSRSEVKDATTSQSASSLATELVKTITKSVQEKADIPVQKGVKKRKVGGEKGSFGEFDMQSHYAECYPGGLEEFDGNYDSDEDADFTKMDMGNKKGPVKRWDFENDEDYSQYQSKREALPKAAFQYGVKMSEGRKTRRYGGGGASGKSKEKAKLDREWQQISAILDKRKGRGGEGAPSSKRNKL